MTEPTNRDDLPLTDYDHIPSGALAERIRSLTYEQLSALLAYERSHGDRLPVVQLFEARLQALRNGAQPAGSLPPDFPEISEGNAQQTVTPATSGPPVNPPSHGDPTNPAQPRS